VAPALHSLTIHNRHDAADILELPLKIRSLKELRIEHYILDFKDISGPFANIVSLYPDLEVLSLAGNHRLTSSSYRLIPRLRKLSELDLSYCQVEYVYVKQLDTHIYICEYM
jgi:hypothetical protein